MQDLQNAVKQLHKIGPQTVAVSSAEIGDKLTAIFSKNKGNEVIKFALKKNKANEKSNALSVPVYLYYSFRFQTIN